MDMKIDAHEALIYGMVTMSAVDRQVTESELARIGNIVRYFPVFTDYDADNLVQTAEACGNALSEGMAAQRMLEMISDALPPKLHETAYALAVEVAAADLRVAPEEMRLLEMMRSALGIDRLVAAAIERGARARHQLL